LHVFFNDGFVEHWTLKVNCY